MRRVRHRGLPPLPDSGRVPRRGELPLGADYGETLGDRGQEGGAFFGRDRRALLPQLAGGRAAPTVRVHLVVGYLERGCGISQDRSGRSVPTR